MNTNGWTIEDVAHQIISNQAYVSLKPHRYADPEEKASFDEAEEELHELAVKFEQMGGQDELARRQADLDKLAFQSMSEDANAYFE